MSYTKQDVKDLSDALGVARAANQRTREAVMEVFDFDFETARTAEALQLLNDADDKIEAAVTLLAREYDRIGLDVAVDEAAGVER